MNEFPVLTEQRPNRWRRVSAVTGAGLLAGLIAIGIGGVAGVASAQTVITETNEPAHTVVVGAGMAQGEGDEVDELEGHSEGDFEISPEDDAVFERFEQCLQAAGLDLETEAEAEVEPEGAAVDAAFEKCDPILEELSDGFDGLFAELSPADEAIYEQYDECLQGAGLDFESDVEPNDEVFDAAFEKCDPILEGLSAEAQGAFGDFDDAFGDLSPEDEAVFERYDTCLDAAGLNLDAESEAEFDEAAFDAAFEKCDPILEELSAEAQELFDCPEDEDA